MIPALQALVIVWWPLIFCAAGLLAWSRYTVRAADIRANAEAKFAEDRRATKSFAAFLLAKPSTAATEAELPEMRTR